MSDHSTVADKAPTESSPSLLRQMHMSDLPKVLNIIEAYDDDDSEAAESDYHNAGFDNQFVMEVDNNVIGVTGYREVEATDNTAWLSWTYLDKAYRGQGLGKKMTSLLLDKLRAANGRKIFVKVSDYDDPEEGKIYERALKMYHSLGFQTEVTSYDFYDKDENQFILGLNLKDDELDQEEPDIAAEKPVIRFNGLHEIAETEGSYTFSWVVEDSIKLMGKRNFSTEDLTIGIESVIQQDGRKIFLTFPSNLVLIHTPLQAAGFKYVGELKNYYELGIHELHFTHDLSHSINTD